MIWTLSKEHNFYLLYYPATFDAVDRIRFSHLVIEFRNMSRTLFESQLLINKPIVFYFNLVCEFVFE
jgi:hypothetical protein